MGHRHTEESRRRISETRRRMYAEGKLVSNARKEQVPSISHVDPSFGYWFSGFIDGEGCFSVSRHPNGGIKLVFVVTLRDDDTPVLEEVQQTLGFGSLRHGKTKTTDTVTFSITSFVECRAMVNLFERFPLRSRKKADFEAWAAIVKGANESYSAKFDDFLEQVEAMRRIKGRVPKEVGSSDPGVIETA